jgi:hypothetical protein
MKSNSSKFTHQLIFITINTVVTVITPISGSILDKTRTRSSNVSSAFWCPALDILAWWTNFIVFVIQRIYYWTLHLNNNILLVFLEMNSSDIWSYSIFSKSALVTKSVSLCCIVIQHKFYFNFINFNLEKHWNQHKREQVKAETSISIPSGRVLPFSLLESWRAPN